MAEEAAAAREEWEESTDACARRDDPSVSGDAFGAALAARSRSGVASGVGGRARGLEYLEEAARGEGVLEAWVAAGGRGALGLAFGLSNGLG